MDLLRWVRNAIQWRPSPRQGSVQPYGGSSCPSHGGRPHPPMAPWPTILNELTEAQWLPTAIDPRTQLVTGAAMPVALPLSDRRTHTRHTMSWGSLLFAVGSRLWPHAQERSKSVEMNRGRTFKALHGRQEVSQSTIHRALAHHRPFPVLDFTQNPGKVMDDITFVRSHWWLVSEGFSLSTANSDVQKLPATLYHRIADSLAYAA